MRIALVVGQSYVDMSSIRRYVERMQKTDTLVFLRPVQSAGELLALRAAERVRIPLEMMLTGDSVLEKLQARVSLVKSVDEVVLFDDGGTRIEHFYNLAEVNKKTTVHFREVKHGLKH